MESTVAASPPDGQFMALPGGELVAKGLADLASGAVTAEALLVEIGAPRLRDLGIAVPADADPLPEHRLYSLLCKSQGAGAHSAYNALIRRLVSFERAASCAHP